MCFRHAPSSMARLFGDSSPSRSGRHSSQSSETVRLPPSRDASSPSRFLLTTSASKARASARRAKVFDRWDPRSSQ